MTDISVIIPSRDPDPTQLAEQLAALAGQQTSASYEVVVVDNGSARPLTELVPERVGPAAARVVDASYSPGISVARNAGIRAAAADRMVVCDSDDIVTPGWLDAALRALRHGDLVVGGPLRPFTHELGDLDPPRPSDQLAVVDGRPFASGCNVGFTRGVVERTGGFDESWPIDGSAEDLDFSRRCADAGIEFRFEPAMEVNYRLRPELLGVLRQRRFYGRGDVRFSDRHGWPAGRAGCRRRVIGQLRGVAWFLPRAVRTPRGGWHVARRLGSALGGIDGLLRPVARGGPRGVQLDLDQPSATVVVGPVEDVSGAVAAAAELTATRSGVEVVLLADGPVSEPASSSTVELVAADGRTVEQRRDAAARVSERDVVVVLGSVPSAERLDRHLAALSIFDLSVDRGARWVRTRRLGRQPILPPAAVGIRRSELETIGGLPVEVDAALGPVDLGLRVAAAQLRVADVSDGDAPSEEAPVSVATAFDLGRRATALRPRHPELPAGAVVELIARGLDGRPARWAAVLGYVAGRLGGPRG
ncbi:MAG: glycosyltransferase [Actinomycetota bacterium]